MVLAAGVLLLIALGVFLVVAKFRHPINLKELPKRLGVDIQQEANGVTYSHSLGAHSQYKIHASKEVQLKQGIVELHDVKIELFGADGSRVDRISGDEFEYDPKSGKATAAGPVEILLMRPGVAPAIAPKAIPDKAVGNKVKSKPLAAAAETAAAGEIHVETSGLSFDWNSGVTTTSKHVDFSMKQGAGSSMGASYDSQQGVLVLMHEVELTSRRGGDTVGIHAQRAVFERDNLACELSGAKADYRGGQATANEATILFRSDGSAVQMDVMNGFVLATASGGHLAAPKGAMEFDEHNQPRHGHMEGGVRMDSVGGNREMHGTSPAVELGFNKKGELRLAHLERGVEMRSEEVSQAVVNGAEVPQRLSRTWRSPVADVAFREAKREGSGHGGRGAGKLEPASIHGTGGVVISGESQRGKAAAVPSRLAANELTGEFGPNSTLISMTGVGHASMEETTATGATETASGDRLAAKFEAQSQGGTSAATQIHSAVLDGHVVLVEQAAAKKGSQAETPMRAMAGHAEYEGAGQWLHLTMTPRAEDGAMQLTADKLDVSQASGEAFARGNVKATWLDSGKGENAKGAGVAGQESMSLGGQGPAHAIAQEARWNHASDEITFSGHPRLWQQANSIAGPVIVIDRRKNALVARSTDRGEPVQVVLLSAGGADAGPAAGKVPGKTSGKESGVSAGGGSGGPSVIRVRGGELDYTDKERKAVMVGGALGTVVAETGTATSVSNQVDLYLVPAGKGSVREAGQGQVDRMRASGHVVVTSLDRQGTGEELTYASATGEYVLTGTAAKPPRITDAARGNVTGEALIFNSRDDSVSIEGGGSETRTETTVRQGDGRSEQHK